MKLNHRNWLIIDANGKIINVQGEGVVGEFPTLNLEKALSTQAVLL